MEPPQGERQKPLDDKNDHFIGMWRDREDMEDASKWVRNLRRREWE